MKNLLTIRVRQFLQSRKDTFRIVRRVIYISILVGVVTFVLLFGSMFRGSNLQTFWLPPANTAPWPDGRISVFESSHTDRSWQYGTGTVFTTTDGWATLFEAPAGQLGLIPSQCPNVFNETDIVVPSGCDKIGTVKGTDIYRINRSLPMGVSDAYTVIGTTFIAYKVGMGSDAEILRSLQTFTPYNPLATQQFLAASKKSAALHNQKITEAENQQKALEAVAYQTLPFTPALPATIPDGWETNNEITIWGDGQPPAPRFISIDYRNKKDHKLFIELKVGKMSDFTLSATCGPTIGAGAKYLPCQLLAGTHYYEAWDAGTNYSSHYLYQPIGDALATVVASHCCSEKAHNVASDQLSAQQAFMRVLRPVSKDVLKNAMYKSGASGFLR